MRWQVPEKMPETLAQYAREWAWARRSQGGFVFAWANQGKFCHVRRDTQEEMMDFSFHPVWVIVEVPTGEIVQSNGLEDVGDSSPAPDIPA